MPTFRFPHLNDGAWLRQRYLVDEWSIEQIAAAAECEKTTIYSALNHHGIPRRRPPTNDWSDVLTKEFLLDRMERGYTSRQMAAEVGCHPSAITRAKARHQLLTLSEPRAEKLRHLYVDKGLGSTTIARMIGVQEDTVARWVAAAGLTLRGPTGDRPPVAR